MVHTATKSVMREAVPSVVNRDFNYNQVDSKFRGELKSNPGKTAVLLGFVTTPKSTLNVQSKKVGTLNRALFRFQPRPHKAYCKS